MSDPLPDPWPRPHPRQRALLPWAAMGLVAAGLILALALRGTAEAQGVPPSAQFRAPPLWTLPILSAIAGAGITLPLALLWINRAHWRAILRFRWAKLGAALLMAGLTPVMIWGPLPSALGFWLCFFGLMGIEQHSVPALLGTIGTALGAAALAFPLASALIWGLRRGLRLAAFIAFYAGQVALVAALGRIASGAL